MLVMPATLSSARRMSLSSTAQSIVGMRNSLALAGATGASALSQALQADADGSGAVMRTLWAYAKLKSSIGVSAILRTAGVCFVLQCRVRGQAQDSRGLHDHPQD